MGRCVLTFQNRAYASSCSNSKIIPPCDSSAVLALHLEASCLVHILPAAQNCYCCPKQLQPKMCMYVRRAFRNACTSLSTGLKSACQQHEGQATPPFERLLMSQTLLQTVRIAPRRKTNAIAEPLIYLCIALLYPLVCRGLLS